MWVTAEGEKYPVLLNMHHVASVRMQEERSRLGRFSIVAEDDTGSETLLATNHPETEAKKFLNALMAQFDKRGVTLIPAKDDSQQTFG